MNVNRSNQINGYHRSNQIKKQNMKLSEQKKGWWTPVPEPPGEGAGTSGRTSTGADRGRADTGAHGGYQSRRGGSKDTRAHQHRGRRWRESARAPGHQGRRGEVARAPAAETLAAVGGGTTAETLAAGGNGGTQGRRRTGA